MKASRVRMSTPTRQRSKLFVLLTLFVAGSVLSILTTLIQPDQANAITDTQKDYCVTAYPSGKQVATAAGTNKDWTDNSCAQICTTTQTVSTGITYSSGCDKNKVPSEAAPTSSDTATLGILADKYGNSAVTGYCGSNQACISQWQSKIRDRMKVCVNSYNYDDNNQTVFPDMDVGILANCVASGLGFSSTKEEAIKKQLGKDHDAITAEAQQSSDASTKDSCESGGGTWDADNETCQEPEGTDCAIDGIGWLVCPAIIFIAGLNDKAYAFLASNFLSVDTNLVSGAKDAWAKFRDIANVLFVIAFLVVVYSQLTSVGINNYGIKKMLPKIVIAAVLVNMSYIICQLAVDVSNILGYGITALFGSIKVGENVTDTSSLSLLGNNLTWVAAFGAILATVAGVALAVGFPVILSALLAIGLIVLILIGRQALIVLLIAIAPVAFVAYLLPNTEQWFKKWVKMFSTLLLLFPIIGLVFGASRLAAIIVNNAAGSDPLMQVVALGITALPFFVVPGLLKGALAAAGSVGSKLSGMADKAGKNVGSTVKNKSRLGTLMSDASKYREQRRNIRYAQKRGTGVLNRATGRVFGGKGYNDKARLRANTLENQEYEEDVKAAEEILKTKTYNEKHEIAKGNIKTSAEERDAAIRFMMASGNFDERRSVLESIGDMTSSQRKSAVAGARSKGDTGVYGSKTLGSLEEGRIDNDGATEQLKRGAVDRVEKGEATAETFTRDSYTANYVASNAKNASGVAQKKFADNLHAYADTEAGQKMPIAVRDHVTTVVNNAAAAPSSSPPAQPTGNTGTGAPPSGGSGSSGSSGGASGPPPAPSGTGGTGTPGTP